MTRLRLHYGVFSDPRFHGFRTALRWNHFEALGFLVAFRELAIDQNQSGVIADWTPSYIADVLGAGKMDPQKIWDALVEFKFIEIRQGKQVLGHWDKIERETNDLV